MTTFTYTFTINNPLKPEDYKDGELTATDMNDACNQVTSLCPTGWSYANITKVMD